MSNQYLSIHFNAPQEKAEIISAILLNAGFEGVEEKENEFVASIKKDLLDEAWLKEFMASQGIDFTIETVEQQNWNATWDKSFEPVTVEDFSIIRAAFHEPVPGYQHDIIITPKMSFGTGHHATTYLMIKQMRDVDFRDKPVIDFGTGTAVLAILAEKLGALHVLATDIDEWSINNSIENLEANQSCKITTLLADGFPAGQTADIILANINLNVIIDNLAGIKKALNPGGKVMFSGLLKADEETISRHLQMHGLHVDNLAERNGWICLLTSS